VRVVGRRVYITACMPQVRSVIGAKRVAAIRVRAAPVQREAQCSCAMRVLRVIYASRRYARAAARDVLMRL